MWWACVASLATSWLVGWLPYLMMGMTLLHRKSRDSASRPRPNSSSFTCIDKGERGGGGGSERG